MKFTDVAGVRLRAGRLVSKSGADLAGVQRVLAKKGVSIEPMFRSTETALDQLAKPTGGQSRAAAPNLNQWYKIRLTGVDPAPILAALKALNVVEMAYPEPLSAPPPTKPGNYSHLQEYRTPLDGAQGKGGIDAQYAWTVPGGTGANVRVADIEYAWNVNHEDVSKLRLPGAVIKNGEPFDPRPDLDHGTNVVGILSADKNEFGMTGLVHDAGLHVINAMYGPEPDIPNAIYLSFGPDGQGGDGPLRAGDVLLIEHNVWAPHEWPCGRTERYKQTAPVEWTPAIKDAIKAAVAKGIIVVETAGNSGEDLDDACKYGQAFSTDKAQDSGAIIVGAGHAPNCESSGWRGGKARSRLYWSTYGERVDLQGWGECVATTGYSAQDAAAGYEHTRLPGYNPRELNKAYTHSFAGTSSAAPMVAAAAASLSSIAKQRGYTLTPREVRSRLKGTGTPQEMETVLDDIGTLQTSGKVGKIGRLPNLRRAIEALPMTSCGGAPAWNSSTQYAPEQQVTYNGRLWHAEEYSTHVQPDAPWAARMWSFVRTC